MTTQPTGASDAAIACALMADLPNGGKVCDYMRVPNCDSLEDVMRAAIAAYEATPPAQVAGSGMEESVHTLLDKWKRVDDTVTDNDPTAGWITGWKDCLQGRIRDLEAALAAQPAPVVGGADFHIRFQRAANVMCATYQREVGKQMLLSVAELLAYDVLKAVDALSAKRSDHVRNMACGGAK